MLSCMFATTVSCRTTAVLTHMLTLSCVKGLPRPLRVYSDLACNNFAGYHWHNVHHGVHTGNIADLERRHMTTISTWDLFSRSYDSRCTCADGGLRHHVMHSR